MTVVLDVETTVHEVAWYGRRSFFEHDLRLIAQPNHEGVHAGAAVPALARIRRTTSDEDRLARDLYLILHVVLAYV